MSNKTYDKVSAWGFFWYKILFAIPVAGFIALIIISFAARNLTLRSFARSYFCGLLLCLILIGIILLIGLISGSTVALTDFINNLKDLIMTTFGLGL